MYNTHTLMYIQYSTHIHTHIHTVCMYMYTEGEEACWSKHTELYCYTNSQKTIADVFPGQVVRKEEDYA